MEKPAKEPLSGYYGGTNTLTGNELVRFLSIPKLPLAMGCWLVDDYYPKPYS